MAETAVVQLVYKFYKLVVGLRSLACIIDLSELKYR